MLFENDTSHLQNFMLCINVIFCQKIGNHGENKLFPQTKLHVNDDIYFTMIILIILMTKALTHGGGVEGSSLNHPTSWYMGNFLES